MKYVYCISPLPMQPYRASVSLSVWGNLTTNCGVNSALLSILRKSYDKPTFIWDNQNICCRCTNPCFTRGVPFLWFGLRKKCNIFILQTHSSKTTDKWGQKQSKHIIQIGVITKRQSDARARFFLKQTLLSNHKSVCEMLWVKCCDLSSSDTHFI